jgi:hypothetical protein
MSNPIEIAIGATSIQEFRRDAQVNHDKQKAKLDEKQDEIIELKERIGRNLVLDEWQTTSLVMCGEYR